jgi:CheY-like chemotaxis protein
MARMPMAEEMRETSSCAWGFPCITIPPRWPIGSFRMTGQEQCRARSERNQTRMKKNGSDAASLARKQGPAPSRGADAASPDSRHNPDRRTHRHRILVIDHDPAARVTLERALRSAGHDVRSAGDREQGMVLFRIRPADVVVVCLFMPEQMGMETVMDLRRDFPHLPIIAFAQGPGLTNLSSFARWLGATRTLCRSCPPHELLAAVEEVTAGAGQGESRSEERAGAGRTAGGPPYPP